MELLRVLFNKKKAEKQKTRADYQREKLVTFGREQFQKMMKLRLGAPVSLA